MGFFEEFTDCGESKAGRALLDEILADIDLEIGTTLFSSEEEKEQTRKDWTIETLKTLYANYTTYPTGKKGGTRHYDWTQCALQLKDGRWVGYLKWGGGGKHGNPDEIPFLMDCVFLDVREETKVVKVFTEKRNE